jgi:cholesterol oxidase
MTNRKGAHDDDCDVLVIGSGLNGSVAAVQLTEKGDRLRVSTVWRKVSDQDFAETAWNSLRFAWAPLGFMGTLRNYLLGKVMVHAGVRLGSRVLQRIRTARSSTNRACTASTDSGGRR